MRFVDSPSGALRANGPEGPTVGREDLKLLHTARAEDSFHGFGSVEIFQILSTFQTGNIFAPRRRLIASTSR